MLIVWKICSNVPNELIGRLQELFLKYSFFEFDDKLYQQCMGTSMGSKPAPACGNIFMLIYNFFLQKTRWFGSKKFTMLLYKRPGAEPFPVLTLCVLRVNILTLLENLIFSTIYMIVFSHLIVSFQRLHIDSQHSKERNYV